MERSTKIWNERRWNIHTVAPTTALERETGNQTATSTPSVAASIVANATQLCNRRPRFVSTYKQMETKEKTYREHFNCHLEMDTNSSGDRRKKINGRNSRFTFIFVARELPSHISAAVPSAVAGTSIENSLPMRENHFHIKFRQLRLPDWIISNNPRTKQFPNGSPIVTFLIEIAVAVAVHAAMCKLSADFRFSGGASPLAETSPTVGGQFHWTNNCFDSEFLNYRFSLFGWNFGGFRLSFLRLFRFTNKTEIFDHQTICFVFGFLLLLSLSFFLSFVLFFVHSFLDLGSFWMH